ncbi:hypothetical protein [Agaribacterium sp. ZY112]|uniref:hypothetical protein n=1 Tax=Agaribacterium sp. ZY112 TaxID=3233574 RepID=UPI0035268960
MVFPAASPQQGNQLDSALRGSLSAHITTQSSTSYCGVISLRPMNFKDINLTIAFLAVLANALAVKFWLGYLSVGSVSDSKHGLVFLGSSAQGHLIAITLFAIIATYYAIKPLLVRLFKK